MTNIRLGITNLLEQHRTLLAGKQFGLLSNQASLDENYQRSATLLNTHFPKQLTRLFSPQHGPYGAQQDNMIESDHCKDPQLGLPSFSLYSETREPKSEWLDGLDVFVIDLQDVGTRVYTFIYTIANCLKQCKKKNIPVVLLDRPNPLGGTLVEGNILENDAQSFVGMYPIPMRHGLTVGELTTLFNDHFEIGCDLTVIEMDHWRRDQWYDQTHLPWFFPSPNLPTFTSACVYPGQVIFEGTNVSEGRGTTQPFEVLGAPFIDPFTLIEQLTELPGIKLLPLFFEPTSNKHANTTCGGFKIVITDRDVYKPYETALHFYQKIQSLYPEDFQLNQPPYEYEFIRMPIDLIIGSKPLRQALDTGVSIKTLVEEWQPALETFQALKKRFHRYE